MFRNSAPPSYRLGPSQTSPSSFKISFVQQFKMKLRISGYYYKCRGKKTLPSRRAHQPNSLQLQIFYTYFIVKIVLLVIYAFLETVIFRNFILTKVKGSIFSQLFQGLQWERNFSIALIKSFLGFPRSFSCCGW